MNKKVCNKYLYYVSSFAPVIYVTLDMIQKLLRTSYSTNFETPILAFILGIVTPAIVSVLFFIKAAFQKRMASGSSRTINILVTILLMAEIICFYTGFGFLFFVINNPAVTFIACLQVCSLVYDLFLNKN